MSGTERSRGRVRRRRAVARSLRTCEWPLLTVYRSSKHLYAQIFDPVAQRTLLGVSTRSPSVREGLKSTKDVEAAKRVGSAIAGLALARDIKKVTFNRNGFLYIGRVKALAEAAREAGLEF
jgi:large subunit ribosomal protein L18